MKHCLHCGGSDLLEHVGVLDQGDGVRSLSIITQSDPEALIFKGTIKAPVNATVCATCGFVMLFTSPQNVARLKQGAPPQL